MSDIVQRLITASEEFPEIDENPSYLYTEASVEIQHLRARLAAAEADAERYRWLMDNSNIGITERQQVVLYLSKKFYMDCEDGQGFSEAIDSAIDKARGAGDE